MMMLVVIVGVVVVTVAKSTNGMRLSRSAEILRRGMECICRFLQKSAGQQRELFGNARSVCDFAQQHLTPDHFNADVLLGVDLNELCTALCGPILQYSNRGQAFAMGSWIPPGFDVHAIERDRYGQEKGR